MKHDSFIKVTLIYTVIVLSMVLAYVFVVANASYAATSVFSWLPNKETNVIGYRVMCGDTPAAEGGKYAIIKKYTAHKVVNGRVLLNWVGFPEDKKYYCAAVAVGKVGADKVYSDFSEEVVVDPTILKLLPPGDLKASLKISLELVQ